MVASVSLPALILICGVECIVYTWDYHSSISFWTGLRVQPILADEVQTFKALITVHKVLQEGHPVVSPHSSRAPMMTSLRTLCRLSRKLMGRLAGLRRALVPSAMTVLEVRLLPVSYSRVLTCDISGYGPLIRTYVQFILAKLRFHRLRPEFNGLFEYEEYVTLKGIDDPNEGCVCSKD